MLTQVRTLLTEVKLYILLLFIIEPAFEARVKHRLSRLESCFNEAGVIAYGLSWLSVGRLSHDISWRFNLDKFRVIID